TIGVSPMDLLVLPKMLALVVALPLLTVYADILGVFGGMIMAQSQLHVSFTDFLDRFGEGIKISSFLVGVGKAPVFAAIIALVGCFQGFRVSGSADSVGRQTTTSVVQAIFLIIVVDALFSVIFSWLQI
ncbi:MAG: ABC transporter permease, partial [Sulfuricella sp.]|nr:ABC transporter permease [Sulfuricella sp.]